MPSPTLPRVLRPSPKSSRPPCPSWPARRPPLSNACGPWPSSTSDASTHSWGVTLGWSHDRHVFVCLFVWSAVRGRPSVAIDLRVRCVRALATYVQVLSDASRGRGIALCTPTECEQRLVALTELPLLLPRLGRILYDDRWRLGGLHVHRACLFTDPPPMDRPGGNLLQGAARSGRACAAHAAAGCRHRRNGGHL